MSDEPIIIKIDGYNFAFRILNSKDKSYIYLCHYNPKDSLVLGAIEVYSGTPFKNLDEIFAWCNTFLKSMSETKPKKEDKNDRHS